MVKQAAGKQPNFGLSIEIEPMEAKSAETLPSGEGWQYEPKWDGFRCIAFKNGGHVDLRAKSGKPLGRYFPEMVALLSALPVARFVFDVALAVENIEAALGRRVDLNLHTTSEWQDLQTDAIVKSIVLSEKIAVIG
jgi:ATP-dependent DNA ligase